MRLSSRLTARPQTMLLTFGDRWSGPLLVSCIAGCSGVVAGGWLPERCFTEISFFIVASLQERFFYGHFSPPFVTDQNRSPGIYHLVTFSCGSFELHALSFSWHSSAVEYLWKRVLDSLSSRS